MREYIKRNLIGGESPKYFNIFSSNSFILAVHYIYISIHAVVDCTHIYNIVYYKIIRTHHILLLLLTAPMKGQQQLLSRTW